MTASSKEMEQQLQAELDTANSVSGAEDQPFSVLEEELQARDMKISSLSDQHEQQQGELEMPQQKSKWMRWDCTW